MRTRALPILAVTCLTLLQAACTHTDIAHDSFWREHRVIPVEITGPAPKTGAPTAVDIRNHRGAVVFEVDRNIDAPEIRAQLIRPKNADGDSLPDTDAPGTVTAQFENAADAGIPANASTLRISTHLDDTYPDGTGITLRVRVPRCDGVNIINDGGPIIILGTDGAVTAQNGINSGDGGRIEFRTSYPLRDPVALVTIRGRITAVIDPEGAARVELDTEEGQAFFGSAYGRMTEVRPGERSYHGTWNGGVNPFIARSARGDVTVFVKPAAEQYSTADDWLAFIRDE